ncbi:MAG: PH domain-containing protein [Thermoprotei archaeon]
MRVYNSEYFVTTYRTYVKYGLISRRIFEIHNEWITSTSIRQGIIQRMLNCGDLIFSTPRQYFGSVFMKNVSDPTHVRTIVEDVLRRLKEIKSIKDDLRQLEKEYEFGRISKEKYKELKKKYEKQLRTMS